MTATSDMPPAEILRWMAGTFDVDPLSGSMIWQSPPKNHPRLLGKPAGCLRLTRAGKRYCHIKKDGIPLKRGWLIFLWSHGRWPSPCLDHINGNSEDDRILNIREATFAQNAWNHKTRARRLPLPMGVRINASSGRYGARIAHNKKMIHLGSFDTVNEAHRVYVAKRKELYYA